MDTHLCLLVILRVLSRVNIFVCKYAYVSNVIFCKSDCTLCTVKCTLDNVHSTRYTVNWTKYTLHCTLYIEKVYTVHCKCTLYTAKCFFCLLLNDHHVISSKVVFTLKAELGHQPRSR